MMAISPAKYENGQRIFVLTLHDGDIISQAWKWSAYFRIK
jgi:hypothetical protein